MQLGSTVLDAIAAHRIEGIGIGYQPPMWDARIVDEVIPVASDGAETMVRRLSGSKYLSMRLYRRDQTGKVRS
jgi:cysteine synthase